MRNWKACLVAVSFAVVPASVVAAANEDGEEIPPQEAAAIAEVKELIRKQVQADAAKEGHAFRDAHRKHHGCVRAKFAVKEGLAPQLRQGLFSKPETYSAVIRYSNGSGRVDDDHDGDGRGMAVKLLGVTGERNIGEADDEATSQDFVMVNYPVFFVRNAEKYVGFQKAAQSNVFLWVFNPVRFFHEGLIGLSILMTRMTNPLDATYFSMLPSKLGATQMKFRATPCPGSRFNSPSDSRDRLRENLTASLSASPACFLFQVQRRTEPDKMPIEDPTIEWKEIIAPFETVAEISIPAQPPELGEACESISYNPWNGLREHRPLGGISRTRKEVYQAISRIRHEMNNQKREEPVF